MGPTFQWGSRWGHARPSDSLQYRLAFLRVLNHVLCSQTPRTHTLQFRRKNWQLHEICFVSSGVLLYSFYRRGQWGTGKLINLLSHTWHLNMNVGHGSGPGSNPRTTSLLCVELGCPFGITAKAWLLPVLIRTRQELSSHLPQQDLWGEQRIWEQTNVTDHNAVQCADCSCERGTLLHSVTLGWALWLALASEVRAKVVFMIKFWKLPCTLPSAKKMGLPR